MKSVHVPGDLEDTIINTDDEDFLKTLNSMIYEHTVPEATSNHQLHVYEEATLPPHNNKRPSLKERTIYNDLTLTLSSDSTSAVRNYDEEIKEFNFSNTDYLSPIELNINSNAKRPAKFVYEEVVIPHNEKVENNTKRDVELSLHKLDSEVTADMLISTPVESNTVNSKDNQSVPQFASNYETIGKKKEETPTGHETLKRELNVLTNQTETILHTTIDRCGNSNLSTEMKRHSYEGASPKSPSKHKQV